VTNISLDKIKVRHERRTSVRSDRVVLGFFVSFWANSHLLDLHRSFS